MRSDSTMLTTGQVAEILGYSRQHVVNLCDSGALPCVRVGSHRRVASEAVHAMLGGRRTLRREEERSLWLHRALLGPLLRDPQEVISHARSNIRRWRSKHRADGMSQAWLDRWESLLDQGVDEVADVLASRDPVAVELRANSPFAGILAEADRRAVHEAFRRHWATTHRAA